MYTERATAATVKDCFCGNNENTSFCVLLSSPPERYRYVYMVAPIYIHWWLIALLLLHTMIIRIPVCRKCYKYQ